MRVCPYCRIAVPEADSTCPRDNESPVQMDSKPIPKELSERFHSVEEFGAGGTGILYRANDTLTQQQGLIKTIRITTQSHATERMRIKRELTKQTTLSDNVCPVIASGEYTNQEDGKSTPWLFRKWIEGESLKLKLKRDGRLKISSALSIAAQIASGLDILHRAGLLHRDIKPGHILLQDHPSGNPSVVLIDAGITDRIETKSLFDIMGTPAYLSPEHISGKLTSFRSDLYALGCVLYEMLTGNPPFTERGLEALFQAHRTKPVPSPDVDLPEPIISLLQSLLAKDPKVRPFSAQKVIRSLKPFLPRESPLRRAPSSISTFAKQIRVEQPVRTATGILSPASIPPPIPPSARRKGRPPIPSKKASIRAPSSPIVSTFLSSPPPRPVSQSPTFPDEEITLELGIDEMESVDEPLIEEKPSPPKEVASDTNATKVDLADGIEIPVEEQLNDATAPTPSEEQSSEQTSPITSQPKDEEIPRGLIEAKPKVGLDKTAKPEMSNQGEEASANDGVLQPVEVEGDLPIVIERSDSEPRNADDMPSQSNGSSPGTDAEEKPTTSFKLPNDIPVFQVDGLVPEDIFGSKPPKASEPPKKSSAVTTSRRPKVSFDVETLFDDESKAVENEPISSRAESTGAAQRSNQLVESKPIPGDLVSAGLVVRLIQQVQNRRYMFGAAAMIFVLAVFFIALASQPEEIQEVQPDVVASVQTDTAKSSEKEPTPAAPILPQEKKEEVEPNKEASAQVEVKQQETAESEAAEESDEKLKAAADESDGQPEAIADTSAEEETSKGEALKQEEEEDEPDSESKAQKGKKDEEPEKSRSSSRRRSKRRSRKSADSQNPPSDKLLASRMDQAQELRTQAREHYKAARYSQAAKLYQQSTRLAPTHAGSYAGLGASYLALHKTDKAIDAYLRAIQLQPKSSGFHAALGRAYNTKGDRVRAIAAYRKAVELNPKNRIAKMALKRLTK